MPWFLTFSLLATLAQQGPTPTGFELIDLITTLGVSGIFVFLYFDERKERRAAQAQISQLLERIIPALTESTSTLERVQDSMKRELRLAQQPDTHALESDIQALIEELRKQGRP